MFLRLVLISLISILSACSVSLKEQHATLISNLEGKWDDVSENACETGFKTVKFSEDGKKLFITYSTLGHITEDDSREVLEYDILGYSNNRIRMVLKNEPRLDFSGNPIVWHLVSTSRDTYCWGRDNAPMDFCTTSRYRCD